jgi:asparagine synthase (glutamine-hydrolysing)
MCAIVGITGENISEKLYKMLTTLKHRGPDGSGVFVDGKLSYGDLDSLKVPGGNLGMGHNLLSIVGCEGSQPLLRDNFVLICNGEIYNYMELKEEIGDDFRSDSDCEAIIGLVKKFYQGYLCSAIIKTLKYLDGDYAFAIYDGKDLAVIRDPVGVKPLYFGEDQTKNTFAFASERKALWEVGINTVETLPPGYMLYNFEMVKLDDGLRLEYKIDSNLDGGSLDGGSLMNGSLENKPLKNKLKYQLKESLINSVEKRVKGLSKVGVMFSGGVDSTLLSQISDGLGVETVLYSVGHKDSVDLKFARKTAMDMGLPIYIQTLEVDDVKKYLSLVLNAIEEFNLMKLGVGMPAYIAAEMAHQDGIKVMLSGQGADELFAGYHRYLKFYHQKGEHAQKDLKEDVLNLYQVNLQRDDAVTMASSVELRVPYLDLDIINIAMNIPMKYKINGKNDPLRKCILREVASELGVPAEIVRRPKKAAQYGSGIHKMLMKKVLKDEAYMDTLNSFRYLKD